MTASEIKVDPLPTCEPLSPKVIIYPRTPKTGSTMLMGILYSLQEKNGFQTKRPMPFYDVDAFRADIDAALRSEGLWLVQNHNYLPWQEYQNDSRVAYINLIREPYNRCISYYKYMTYGTSKRAGKLDITSSKQANEHLVNCINTINCTIRCGIPMYKHFCGGLSCELEESIDSLVLPTMVLGAEELFLESVSILERKFPAFFKGIVHEVAKHMEKNVKMNVGFRTEGLSDPDKMKFNRKVMASNDIMFYAKAVSKFWRLYDACAGFRTNGL